MLLRKGRFSVLVRVARLKCDHTVVLLMRPSPRYPQRSQLGEGRTHDCFMLLLKLVWKFSFFSDPKLSLRLITQLLGSLDPSMSITCTQGGEGFAVSKVTPPALKASAGDGAAAHLERSFPGGQF